MSATYRTMDLRRNGSREHPDLYVLYYGSVKIVWIKIFIDHFVFTADETLCLANDLSFQTTLPIIKYKIS